MISLHTQRCVDRPSMAGYVNMAEPFLAAVHQDPNRVAVLCEREQVTYAELNRQVNRMCALLRAQGVEPGDKVAYLLPNGATLVSVYYAIQKIGAVAVPINFRSIAPELRYFLDSSDAVALVFARAYADTVAGVRGCCPRLRVQLCVDGTTGEAADARLLLATCSDAEPEMFADARAVSRIQFTGGSTGAPKGAERTHRADLVEVEGTYGSNWLYADEAKIVLIQCPMEHHGGHAWFTIALSLGATLVLCTSFDPATILSQIERHQVSYMILLPPTTYVRLMEHPAIGEYDLSSVRLVQSSAGGTSPEIVADIYRYFPNAVMNYGWGQTETGLGSSLVLTREMAAERQPRIHSVGVAMPLIELKVVDDDGEEVGVGEVGECVARSDALMRGYYGQPELTARAFTADGWLRTGDLMVRDADGYLYLTARKRELIKSGGENVFVGEVENVVREHPAVLDVLIYGRPDPVMGEAVAAAVELRPGHHLTLNELQEFCRQRLASYKKPRSLSILDTLDRDFSGKVRRERVVRSSEEAIARVASIEARPDLDAVLTQVWSDPEVFRIELPQRPGRTQTTNAFVVRAPHGGILVDPGSAFEETHGTLLRAFGELSVSPDRLEIFLTHEHIDHGGVIPQVRADGRRIVMSAAALSHLRQTSALDYAASVTQRLRAAGFDADQVFAYEELRAKAYATAVAELPVTVMGHGEEFETGGLRARVLLTPGHTEGHACLYLPDSGLLFCGDQILADPVPGLFSEAESFDLLAAYLSGLDETVELRLQQVFPGHGVALSPDAFAARRAEVAEHHRRRLAELVELIADQPDQTAAELIASTGDRRGAAAWTQLSAARRWSIVGTALARLDHLAISRAIRTTVGPDGLTRYHTTP